MKQEFQADALGTVPGRFGWGIEDALILPLVLAALAAWRLLTAAFWIAVHFLDCAFPVLLQVMRFPLFTGRVIGDAITALLRAMVGFLPMSGARRAEWRAVVSRSWAWLRQKISYTAFEQALHDAFERGMAWVFKTCRALTPGGALLVIAGGLLWLPVSFVASTALHAALIANAASLPAWTQLLHLLATIIAKSKLLVLPVYPAAWPQAKTHPLVQATFRAYYAFTRLHLVEKTEYRYRQMERAMPETAEATGYAAHYAAADEERPEKLSDKVKSFFERWSMKFSAEYYEKKEKDEARRQVTDAGM
jgi:hypothetical protein